LQTQSAAGKTYKEGKGVNSKVLENTNSVSGVEKERIVSPEVHTL
jgi:hypothetical protein